MGVSLKKARETAKRFSRPAECLRCQFAPMAARSARAHQEASARARRGLLEKPSPPSLGGHSRLPARSALNGAHWAPAPPKGGGETKFSANFWLRTNLALPLGPLRPGGTLPSGRSPLPRRSVMGAAHWAASPEPAGESAPVGGGESQPKVAPGPKIGKVTS